MSLRSRALLVIGVLVVALAAAPVASAQYPPGTIPCSTSDEGGNPQDTFEPGDVFTVSGEADSFTPSASLILFFDSFAIDSATANVVDGSFELTSTIPADATNGGHTLTVIDADGPEGTPSAGCGITVVGAAEEGEVTGCTTEDAGSDAEDDFAPGESFTVEGPSGSFAADANLEVFFVQDGSDEIADGDAEDNGSFSIDAKIPSGADPDEDAIIRVTDDDPATADAECAVQITDEDADESASPAPARTAAPAAAAGTTPRPTERPRGSGFLPKTGAEIQEFAGVGAFLFGGGIALLALAFALRRRRAVAAEVYGAWTESDVV